MIRMVKCGFALFRTFWPPKIRVMSYSSIEVQKRIVGPYRPHLQGQKIKPDKAPAISTQQAELVSLQNASGLLPNYKVLQLGHPWLMYLKPNTYEATFSGSNSLLLNIIFGKKVTDLYSYYPNYK